MSDEELIKETMMLDYSQLVMHNVYMIKENKRLHSIIKEVREYANTDKNCIPKHIKDYINNLLDKESK